MVPFQGFRDWTAGFKPWGLERVPNHPTGKKKVAVKELVLSYHNMDI